MNARAFLAVLFAALAQAAWAQQAFTNRATELRDRGAEDARAIATLAERTPIKVVAPGGAWVQVESGAQKGWIRRFHMSFPITAETSSGGGNAFTAVTGAIMGNRSAASDAKNANVGIRGLSPEELKNSNPNPAELSKMQSYRSDKPAAERFARDGKLAATAVDYVDEAPPAEQPRRRR